MTAPISNGPTTHGYTTMRDATFTVAACCALCAKKFALLGLVVCVSAKKFALRAQNGSKLAYSGVLGEFFRGSASGGAVLGEFFRASWPCAQVL